MVSPVSCEREIGWIRKKDDKYVSESETVTHFTSALSFKSLSRNLRVISAKSSSGTFVW